MSILFVRRTSILVVRSWLIPSGDSITRRRQSGAPCSTSANDAAPGAPDWRLRVIESPDGTSSDLTAKIDALRTNKMLTRLLYGPRWIGAGSAARILLDMASFGIASIEARRQQPKTWSTGTPNRNPDIALFVDRHRAIVSQLSPESSLGGRRLHRALPGGTSTPASRPS